MIRSLGSSKRLGKNTAFTAPPHHHRWSRMREETVRRFFAGELSARELADEIREAVVVTGRDSALVRVDPMDVDVRVAASHIVRVCDAVLEDELSPEDLSSVGFCLVASTATERTTLRTTGRSTESSIRLREGTSPCGNVDSTAKRCRLRPGAPYSHGLQLTVQRRPPVFDN